MPDTQWENLKEIFHAALALPSAERATYLCQATGHNAELRQAVESLLKSHEEIDHFVDTPAYQAAAEMLVDDTDFKANQIVGHYRIVSLLGEGGMGRVYLAEDTKLQRLVALKFLSRKFTQDEERLRRFEQEARAASSLNHPNILTIHEISEADGHRFIATEFIEGATLRERLQTEIPIDNALEIAEQIASALVAAHRVNIVHRDIKPENVMIRREDGLVKVLDFGLAKMSEQPPDPIRSSLNGAATPFKTSSGVVMGTVAYMSPEQARGDVVDARTDIWSLGVILFEMISGTSPFVAATSNEVISAILSKLPAPQLFHYAHDPPASLEKIVAKALAKDNNQRYQTSKHLLMDLKLAKHALQNEINLAHDKPTDKAFLMSIAQSTKPLSTTTQPASSAEYIGNQVKAHKGSAIALAAIVFFGLVSGIATIGFGWYKLASGHRVNSRSSAPVAAMKIKRVTSDGQTTFATISPDGKYLVHVSDNGTQQSLWMRQLMTYTDEKQILPPAHVRYDGITFSPDGDYIYYVASVDDGDATLYQMSVLGGTPKKLIVDIDTPVTFSPDGRRIAFDRGYPGQGEDALLVASADGTGERKLATRKNDYWWPAWSPDGKIIASRATSRGANDTYRTVVAVQVDDGTVKPIGSKRWAGIGEMVWLRDGGGLVMTAREQESDPIQIWYLSYPAGEAHKITNDLDDYRSIGLATDSSDLVAVRSESSSNIWNLPHGETSRATQLTLTNVDGVKGVSWTSDNNVVYESWASGNSNLWSVGLNGGNPKQLTADSHRDAEPVVSPDGKHVVFHSDRKGHNNIWRMDIDGSNLLQLTDGPGEQSADIAPDGQSVVFTSIRGNVTLWKVSIDGGQPVQLTTRPSGQPAISPDGKLIACNYMVDGRWKVAVIPFDGGEPIVMFDSFTHPNWLPFHWTPDGRGLAYIDQRVPSSIWSVPLSGGPRKLVFDFKSGRVFDFAWTRDGSQFAVARGGVSSDVVLITNFANGLGG